VREISSSVPVVVLFVVGRSSQFRRGLLCLSCLCSFCFYSCSTCYVPTKRVCRSISICSVVFILFAFDQFLLCLCLICSKINGFVFNLFDVSCFYLLCYFLLYFFSTFLFLLALFPARFFMFMFVPFLTRLFVLCAW
jgi:hypothetical protein